MNPWIYGSMNIVSQEVFAAVQDREHVFLCTFGMCHNEALPFLFPS